MSDDGVALRRRKLGARLRELRLECGLTGDQVGQAIDRSASWVSRLEAGRISVRPIDLRRLLDVYDIRDTSVRQELEELTTRRQQHGWWSRYRTAIPDPYASLIGYEDVATVIRSYENIVIPGLLQTREYAEAVIEESILDWSAQDVRERTEVRIRRQDILRKATPPRLVVIIPESVLSHVIGGQLVMARQLDATFAVAARPDVELLVVPSALSRPALSVPGFQILSFASEPPVGYVENLSGGLILDGPEVVRYERYFERLRGLAVGARESLELIRLARAQLVD